MTLEYDLQDDGTMDTVVECHCTECGHTWEERIDNDLAAVYRDEYGDMADLGGLMDDLDVECPECTD